MQLKPLVSSATSGYSNTHRYYIDGFLLSTSADDALLFNADNSENVSTANVYLPQFASRYVLLYLACDLHSLWLVAYFAPWLGAPAFETDAVLVDWVRVTPYLESSD